MSNQSASSPGRSRWLVIGAIVIAVLLGIGRLGAGLLDLSGTGSGPDCDAAISWERAEDHAGEHVTVRGPIVDTTYAQASRGQPTFLNVGRVHPDPNRFTVVIWGDARERFDGRPELTYAGREICVDGEIQMYDGVPEIELDGPAAIRTVD